MHAATPPDRSESSPRPGDRPQLVRGLGLAQATSLNVANMIGVGPFLTIPLFLATLGGPHALVGWIVGGLLVACDGLVWSELGAALPGSGGTYHYLRETFGRTRWGKVLPFLFIWQFLVSGTLEVASGYSGAVQYLEYIFPDLQASLIAWGIPGGKGTIAMLLSLGILWLLCRRIEVVGWLSVALCAGSLLTVAVVITTGLLHFDSRLLDGAWNGLTLDRKFAFGLAGAMRIAVYDYLGYYNVCHLGEEVREPGKTIPRAVLLSVFLVATIYLTMNIVIIGVVPWAEAMKSSEIGALFMERLYGRGAAVALSWMILWTALACVFVMTLGYSRIPYAAARNGDFLPGFDRLHPTGKYPYVSLLALGLLIAGSCYLPFGWLVDAAVTVRIAIQFLGQIVALHLLRGRRPAVPLPFKMWLYPLPSFLAFLGWTYLLVLADPSILGVSACVLGLGIVVFLLSRSLLPRAKTDQETQKGNGSGA